MKKLFAVLMVLVMVVSAFAACSDETDTDKGMTATEGKLIMATNAAFPPYEYKEGEGFKGIDVEIAGKIAEKLGLELEIQDVDFGAIIGGVQSGKFDMGMAGMTVTNDRLEKVNFSSTYATGIQVVIVKEGSDVKSLDDLKDDGSMKYGVQQDTTGDIYASDTPDNGGYGSENVLRFKTGAEAVEALKADKVQAVIIDNEPAKSFVAANEGLTILDGEWVLEDYAIAINKDNKDLLDAVNKALDELKKDGTLDSIIGKYIPADGNDVAEDVTSADDATAADTTDDADTTAEADSTDVVSDTTEAEDNSTEVEDTSAAA